MTLPQAARPLERRLAASYLLAFGVVLAVFALGVHLAFAIDLQRDTAARVAELIGAGREAVEIKGNRMRIDVDGVQLTPRMESIEWFDARGDRMARRGFATPDVATSDATISPSRDGVTPNAVSVRVAVSRGPAHRILRRVDIGLAFGLVGGLAAAAIGGRYLARRAIARILATMRTLSDFTSDAAHELRGPLAALASNAGASLRDPRGLPPEHERRLHTIAATAAQMAHTVDDLLLLARAETPIERELFVVDLSESIAKVVDARRALAGERRINLESHAVAARIYGNPNEIDRILGNLLDNALRYTPPDGTVAIGCVHERGGVSVRVRDTGSGIPPDALPRVFDRFWRGDDARSKANVNGSGLGLAIVRALVCRHGGDVSAHSALGTGSEFVVWLPDRPPRPPLHDFSTVS